MSFGVGTVDEGGQRRYVSVGTNGSQDVLLALLFGAYAADRRPESNRVCAWVDSRWERGRALHPDAPRTARNRPATVRELLAFNYDCGNGECCAAVPQRATIARGVKRKPPTDPALVALVALYERFCDDADYAGTMDAGDVVDLAPVVGGLTGQLEVSCWYPIVTAVAELFVAAAVAGSPVTYG